MNNGYFYNGEPIDFNNNLDLWDKFKVTFGFNVTRSNGKFNFGIVDSLLLLRAG